MEERLCKNCIYQLGEGILTSSCVRAKSFKSLITGDEYSNSCRNERDHGRLTAILFGYCGRKGRYFKPRPFNPPRVNTGSKEEQIEETLRRR